MGSSAEGLGISPLSERARIGIGWTKRGKDACMVAFDEMTGTEGDVRQAYTALDRWLKEAPPEMLALRRSQPHRYGIGVAVLIFAGTQILPGDVAQSILGQSATPLALANLRAEMGLNDPAYIRYFHWLWGILHGDLGTALTSKLDIADSIKGRLWNTLFLAVLCGVITTLLGLACALLLLRPGMPGKRVMRALTVLPIITPPFVIGLALILLFGRSGMVSNLMYEWFDVPRSRWIYGLPGVLLAQVLAFAPIAFLVLIGVVQGISPSLEEASQTLGAKRWQTFRTVTWPLLKPGIANAFLLGFVESLADFANPIVLAGNFEVLATKIFFAIAGAQNDPGRAAVLALVLLVFTLGAFALQQRWLGRASYTTVSG